MKFNPSPLKKQRSLSISRTYRVQLEWEKALRQKEMQTRQRERNMQRSKVRRIFENLKQRQELLRLYQAERWSKGGVFLKEHFPKPTKEILYEKYEGSDSDVQYRQFNIEGSSVNFMNYEHPRISRIRKVSSQPKSWGLRLERLKRGSL